MGKKEFYKLWFKKTFIKPLLIVDFFAGILAIIFGAIIYYHPTWGGTMNMLLWAIPVAVFVAVIVIGFLCAPYIIYKDKEKVASALQEQLSDMKNARPNIEFDVQVAPETLRDVSNEVVVGTTIFAKLLVTNNPISILSRVDAPNVAAHIQFFRENETLFPMMVGRWANTKHQYQGALPNEVAQITLHPNGVPEPLLIALKYTDEETAYGLNVDNEKMWGWRDQKKPIPIGTWRVKIHLQGVNVEETVCLTLKNNGKGTDIELERKATQSIADREGSQS